MKKWTVQISKTQFCHAMNKIQILWAYAVLLNRIWAITWSRQKWCICTYLVIYRGANIVLYGECTPLLQLRDNHKSSRKCPNKDKLVDKKFWDCFTSFFPLPFLFHFDDWLWFRCCAHSKFNPLMTDIEKKPNFMKFKVVEVVIYFISVAS